MEVFPNAAGHRVERPKGTASHILVFVESGQGWLKARERHTLGPGDAALIPHGQAHAYGADPKDPWKIYWFHFDGAGTRELLKWTSFFAKSPELPCPMANSLRRHFRTALTAAEAGYSDLRGQPDDLPHRATNPAGLSTPRQHGSSNWGDRREAGL